MEDGLENIDNMLKVMVWHKVIVSVTAGDDELDQIIYQRMSVSMRVAWEGASSARSLAQPRRSI